MNLNYDLKKLLGKDMGELFIYIDKKKLTMSDFLCYMQYEFFCSFFISVLSDISREQYKDFEFPVFKSEDYGNPFKLTIYFNNQKPKVVDNQVNLELLEKQKYVSIFNNVSNLVFIPNKKNNVEKVFDMIIPENKILFQKILKVIFDKIYLILQNDMSKRIQFDYKNNFLIFILREN
jgi:hypothetical protein